MDGLQLVRAVKSKSAFKSIPVILATGRTEPNAIRECFAAGAADYLAKPVHPHELRARVGAAVRASMLAEELDESNRELVRLSRRAGQAEVATGVLHNVGNALNSVNTSIKLLRGKTHPDMGQKLTKLGRLLRTHEAELERLLGERGPALCDYVDQLAKWDREERESLLDEITHLERVVDHAKVVIASQQDFAKAAPVVAPVPVAKVVQFAEEVARSALGTILVEKSLGVARVLGDECRIVQVLANLLSNAGHAVEGVPEARVALSCYEEPSTQTVRFLVEDNGMGIPIDALPHVFDHGSSSKGAQGSGFGLHYSINAAREMAGDLLARSAGVGKGASFELVLPLAPDADPATFSQAPDRAARTGVDA
jgi:signal transduction histidine kinase